MISISVDELDLLTFFECEPKTLDSDMPWVYNDLLYEFTSGEYSLSFAIAPAYIDVRLNIKREQEMFYELNALGMDNVIYHSDNGRETLELVINAQDRLWLRLKPHISITHDAKERT